ncbi:hypothetical protein [Thermobispora bispora]|uniref:hypothetical protein n=1 Tax=Thermobispora bispora TaxID=2006 RepID=UPI00197F3ED1|nr:hypothetical protein [Thermobispora bispora]QSI49999.1 hypothetical protein CYL17_18680 [Thermobispora bispora]
MIANLLEVVSVMAAERRIRKPVEVPRPAWFKHGGAGRPREGRASASRRGMDHAFNVLLSTSRVIT